MFPKRYTSFGIPVDSRGEGIWYHVFPFLLGAALILIAWLRRFKWKEKYLFCPKCEHTCEHWEIRDGLCPHDGTTMETLEGFYDRYPERRTKPESFGD